MSVFNEHPSDRYIDIFIEDYLRATEGEYFYWANGVIARIASPASPPARTPLGDAGDAPLAAAGEAVGAVVQSAFEREASKKA